ncbi:phage minor head protein [Candidatus Tokpelaia sp.]|uniref:phage head morphogenesis protein n=1 Tax=Candidatus Tokpelaia sp. TaxID=2233777 RepID=UPI001238E291|nr:phage minor head protein [Candidatus Tokpelaia sp.]KAA6405660.1 hypothetical protein DPQ22_03080 [Candidatus Tokpelaia sp.]
MASDKKEKPDWDEIFKLAPAEMRGYFDRKSIKPSFDYRDFAAEEHAFSLTVAKSTGYDILEDLQESLKKANAERIPYSEWAAQITPILQAKGWWGKKRMVDPKTGEEKLVQLGSPRRLRTIYWANTMTAYAAGEWARTQRNKDFLPFLIYEPSKAVHPRISHERFYGFIARVDDPVWRWLYPPNAWLCQCWVRQISEWEAKKKGYDPKSEMPEWARPVKNKRTGEIEWVPEGIDPSWKNNPGMFRAENVSDFLSDKIENMPEERRKVAIEDIVNTPLLPAMLDIKPPDKYAIPIAPVPKGVRKEFDEPKPPRPAALPAKPAAPAPADRPVAPPAIEPAPPVAAPKPDGFKVEEILAPQKQSGVVKLSNDSLQHIIKEHEERGLGIDDLRKAITVIAAPVGVVKRKEKEGKESNTAIFVGQAGDVWWRVAVKYVATAKEWWLTSFHRKSEKAAKNFLEAAERKGEKIK